MYRTDGFDDVCKKTFERWYLKIEGNTHVKEGRFLEMPVAGAGSRLAIRSFWVKKAGSRAECFFLGVKLTEESYQEVGDYYRLVSALREISIDRVREFISNGQKLSLVLTTPMRRQSIWRNFDQLSGTRLIGAAKFDKNLEEVLLSVSVNNIEDWFERLWLALDPFVDFGEFNVIVSRIQPQHPLTPVRVSTPQEGQPTPTRPSAIFVTMLIGLICGIVIGRISGVRFASKADDEERIARAYEKGRKLGFKEGAAAVRKEQEDVRSDSALGSLSISNIVDRVIKPVRDVSDLISGRTEAQTNETNTLTKVVE